MGAPHAHFNNLCLFSDALGEIKLDIRNIVKTSKEPEKNRVP
jgi:hypothetical protein